MALSGSQITGLGATGFPNQAYLGFSAKTETILVKIAVGIWSRIDTRGQSALSTITDIGSGILSTITVSSGIYSFINSRGQSISSPIDENGQGVDSL